MHGGEHFEDDGDEVDDTSSNDSQDDEDKSCEMQVVPPEHNSSWEWPLSRQEKKQRVAMIERQVHLMDKSELIKDLEHLKSRYVRLHRRSKAGAEPSPISWEAIAE